jgi:hypothetical protein
MITLQDTFILAPYFQYSIAFAMLLLALFSRRRNLNLSDLPIYSAMFVFCTIAALNGVFNGYSINVKQYIITIILLFLNSRVLSVQAVKYLAYLVILSLLIEYIIAYSQFFTTFHFDYVRAFGLIRPVSIFFDMHLTSYFVVFFIFIFGHTYFAGVFSMIFGSFQTVLGWVIVMVKKVNPVMFIVGLILFIYMLFEVGHLKVNPDQRSMLSVLVNFLDYDINYDCLILGCSVNMDTTIGPGVGPRATASDFGYFRILFQYGLIWLVLLLVSLRKYNKFFIFANVVMWVHYPVTLGILGFILFLYFLQIITSMEIDRNRSEAINPK